MSTSNIALIYNVGMGSMHLSLAGKIACNIYSSPTDNCQIWCISSFYPVVNTTVTLEERRVFLKEAHRVAGSKNLLMIDIPQSSLDRALTVFGNIIRNRMPYSNTNGSSMVILLIDTRGSWIDSIK